VLIEPEIASNDLEFVGEIIEFQSRISVVKHSSFTAESELSKQPETLPPRLKAA
jgi:hypothetical protein